MGRESVRTATETERKFDVDDSYARPDLVDLVAVRDDGTDVLVTRYLDTPELRLWREGVVLRHRSGGPDAGWHLKLPDTSGGGADEARVRLEVQLPATSGKGHDDPPAQLLGLVRVLLAGEAVRAQASLRTERTRLRLALPDDTEIAELADDRVAVLDDGTVTSTFRELELEERAGATTAAGREVLGAVAARLQAAGAAPSATSKASRALGDPDDLPALGEEAGGTPLLPPAPALGPGAPASAAVQVHLLTYVRALRYEDLRVRLDAEDSVHQFRVATRRLRSGLRVFRPLLVSGWDGPLRDDLRWLAHGFAPARDAEVLLARLVARADHLPDPDAADAVRGFLRRRLGRELAAARDGALTILDGDRYLALHEELAIAASEPATTKAARSPCREVLPPLVKRAYARLEKATRTLGPDVPDATWHQARITAKRARYAAEACAPALGRPPKRLARELSHVTDTLGEHQDAVVAAETLHRLATSGRVPAATAYWLGVLHERERAAAEAARAQFATVWERAGRRRYRSWLEDAG